MQSLSVKVHVQKGFALLLTAVVLVVIASLWLSTQHEYLFSVFKNEQLEENMDELEAVKTKLLQFAVLQPEIYKTDTSGDMQDATQIPSPGYFPCPDLDGDGVLLGTETSCGNPWISGTGGTGYVPDPTSAVGLGTCNGSSICVGFVPSAITTRNFYFGEAGKFYYVLDERFSNQNPNYVNNNLKRYAPLYPDNLVGDPATASNSLDPFEPILSLNGVGGYIALIIDPGTDGLDSENNGADYIFSSSGTSLQNSEQTDRIVGITYNEWMSLVVHRVCVEQKRIEGKIVDYVDIDDPLPIKHWYNDYDLSSNPGGGSWRTWGEVCP